MPLRPCPEPGCKELVKKGRCLKHTLQSEAVRQLAREEQPGRAMYFTARWKERRQQQLAAYPYCAVCGGKASIADHVVPHRGDPDLFFGGPLQSLCPKCHGTKTARETWHGGKT